MQLVESVRPSVYALLLEPFDQISGAAVDVRGLALPSAAKSKEETLSVQGCLCIE